MAYEEPKYNLIKKTEVYEIRSYEDRLAVKTLQTSGEERAFGRLFKYISGANQSSTKIAMTIPVIQSDEGNGLIMHFFLPKSYSKKTAPLPNANNVELVMVKGGNYAVIKYSGRLTNQNYKRHTTLLKDSLKKDRVSIIGEPIQATYNGPLTPFFLRRNEVMYRINLK
tara:strand:+ start:227 stop:730 length:504 start_codon:yes stop_codon:yes gene_type:complete